MPLRRGSGASCRFGLVWAVGLACVPTEWLVLLAGAAGPHEPVALTAETTGKTHNTFTFPKEA